MEAFDSRAIAISVAPSPAAAPAAVDDLASVFCRERARNTKNTIKAINNNNTAAPLTAAPAIVAIGIEPSSTILSAAFEDVELVPTLVGAVEKAVVVVRDCVDDVVVVVVGVGGDCVVGGVGGDGVVTGVGGGGVGGDLVTVVGLVVVLTVDDVDIVVFLVTEANVVPIRTCATKQLPAPIAIPQGVLN